MHLGTVAIWIMPAIKPPTNYMVYSYFQHHQLHHPPDTGFDNLVIAPSPFITVKVKVKF